MLSNLRGFKSKKQSLLKIAKKIKPSVIVMNETQLKGRMKLELKPFTCWSRNRGEGGGGGIATAVAPALGQQSMAAGEGEGEWAGVLGEDLSHFVIINKYRSEQEDGGEKAGQDYHCHSLPVVSLVQEDLWTLRVLTPPVNGVLLNLSEVNVGAGNTVRTPVLRPDADVTAGPELLLRSAANPSRPVLAHTCGYFRVSLLTQEFLGKIELSSKVGFIEPGPPALLIICTFPLTK